MSKQNIYDNDLFYENFEKIRSKEINFNDIIETPIILGMIPELYKKKVLDIGCGMGQHALQYSKKGALSVLGIDISEKMLAYARKNNAASNIEYRRLAFEELDDLEEKFDVITSSLAFDYVENFELARSMTSVMLYCLPFSSTYSSGASGGRPRRAGAFAAGLRVLGSAADSVAGETAGVFFSAIIKPSFWILSTAVREGPPCRFRLKQITYIIIFCGSFVKPFSKKSRKTGRKQDLQCKETFRQPSGDRKFLFPGRNQGFPTGDGFVLR